MSNSREIIESLLHQQTAVTFQVHGPSMNPTIRDGDRLRVRPLNPEPPPRGSIVLYRYGGRLVVHRLLAREKQTGRCLLAADAALEGDAWIPAGDILGLAESVCHGKKSRRLDNTAARLAGLLRHALRPVRRAFYNCRQMSHAHAPERGRE